MTRYLGITFGPIIRSLSIGVRPKELFSASYMHSLMSKTAIEILNEYKYGDIISPAYDLTEKPLGVGMYPDRIFIKKKGETEISLAEVRDAIFESYLTKLGISDESKKTFIKNYFKIFLCEIEAESDADAIVGLNIQLDALELYDVTPPEDDAKGNPVEKIIWAQSGAIWKDAFGVENSESLSFPDLKSLALQGESKNLKCYHQYICVVQADGDNMGKIIQKTTSVSTVSENLLSFCKKAAHIIRTGYCPEGDALQEKNADCVGLPIYAGGDDLLFIAPVVYKVDGKTKSIFDLLEELDKTYEECVGKKVENPEIKTHLSYGISIAYYKRPLYESLADARSLLFDVAKRYEGKNCIAWKLQKHSGSTVKGIMQKDSSLEDIFKKLLATDPGSDNKNEVVSDDEFLTAICHKIRAMADLLATIGIGNQNHENLKKRLTAFIENILDSDESGRKHDAYIALVEDLMLAVWEAEKDGSEDKKERWAETVYDLLRTARFIRGLDELHKNQ